MIENGKPVGVVLTMEEYELLRSKYEIRNPEGGQVPYGAGPKSETNLSPQPLTSREGNKEEAGQPQPMAANVIGEAMVKEMNFPEASADLTDINFADSGNVTLEDLGLDSDMELPKDF